MATAASINPASTRAAVTGYPEGSLRFDWAYSGLAFLLVVGLMIDGWAHFHGEVDGSFFTPWHLVFYTAFGLVALFTAGHHVRNVRRGYAFTRALPKGYWLSLVGVTVFALGGVGDMVWHTLFGIEAGTEALLSPTHLMLGIGMGLIATGPLRAAWNRTAKPSWSALGPAMIGAALLLVLLAFFTSYAHPFVRPIAAISRSSQQQDAGVAAILLQTAFLSGVTLLLARRWALPFGALTLVLTASAAAMSVLSDLFVLIPSAFAAGVVADTLVWWLKPSLKTGAFHWFAFLVPVVLFSLFMVTVQLAAGMRWSIHVWTGAIFLSGLVGLLLSHFSTLTAAPSVTES